jgi:hypothetical protein
MLLGEDLPASDDRLGRRRPSSRSTLARGEGAGDGEVAGAGGQATGAGGGGRRARADGEGGWRGRMAGAVAEAEPILNLNVPIRDLGRVVGSLVFFTCFHLVGNNPKRLIFLNGVSSRESRVVTCL